MGEDGRCTGSNVVLFDKRYVADTDALDVGDGVTGSWGKDPRSDTELAGPRTVGYIG